MRGRREALRLELTVALGADDPRDEVIVEGNRPLTLRIDGGIPGDDATVAAMIHAAPRVRAAAPGLRTALELSLPRAAPADRAPRRA